MNGKSAIEWVIERQSVTTDQKSGIVKDANAWATETVGDARYPLSLLLRVITVSLETLKIARALPALDILEDGDAGDDEKVATFRFVTPKPSERFSTCVPFIDLRAAAGSWSEVQEYVSELDDPETRWVTWDAAPRFKQGMFVARVVGRSMQPDIPDGAHCLFRRVSLPTDRERIVLVRHGGALDPETGGQFTVKRYRKETAPDGERRIVLQPANPEFAPIVMRPSEAESVQVIAEVVEVLGLAPSARES